MAHRQCYRGHLERFEARNIDPAGAKGICCAELVLSIRVALFHKTNLIPVEDLKRQLVFDTR